MTKPQYDAYMKKRREHMSMELPLRLPRYVIDNYFQEPVNYGEDTYALLKDFFHDQETSLKLYEKYLKPVIDKAYGQINPTEFHDILIKYRIDPITHIQIYNYRPFYSATGVKQPKNVKCTILDQYDTACMTAREFGKKKKKELYLQGKRPNEFASYTNYNPNAREPKEVYEGPRISNETHDMFMDMMMMKEIIDPTGELNFTF